MHFTYNESPDKTTLCQGDVLLITDDLKVVLKETHPYFTKNDYKYFIVLTQTCDLVRRNKGLCNSPYITLAAVRSYNDFIKKVSPQFKVKNVNNFLLLDKNSSTSFLQLIERLYNNNESEYFFLARETEVGLDESMVAFLKVSFALKSDLHYDKCLEAKKIELNDDFKAKLGWLVGQMYSRVGTKDWVSSIFTNRPDFLEMLRNDLTSRFIIVEKDKLKVLENNIINEKLNFNQLNDIRFYLDNIIIEPNYDIAMNIIEDIIKKKNNINTNEEKDVLIRKIRSNSQLRAIIK